MKFVPPFAKKFRHLKNLICSTLEMLTAGIDVRSTDKLKEIFNEFHPNAVVNAIGIIKQLPSAKESIPSIEINALFPHQLGAYLQTK